MSELKEHWIVDYNSGYSACGIIGGVPARNPRDVTCLRCHKLPEFAYSLARDLKEARREEIEGVEPKVFPIEAARR